MKLSNKAYDVLKWIVICLLPAAATLTSVVLSLWDLCSAETVTAIVGTINAVTVFLGALIGVSTATYNKEA